jgi:pSer/pThr/pTyr-binding forkhead associated (FHA) protein
MYKLVISDDEGKTTVVPLIRDEITIGRKEGNTIRLTDRNVSRFHAKVIRSEESFVIEDLGSMGGTNVNAKVLRSEAQVITSGDQVSIGDYSLSIRSDVAADVPMGRQMKPGDQAGIGKVSPHARLVFLTAPQPGREVDLTAELYVIGRTEDANCRIDHQSISRAHARLDLESGKWTISDLDSINGIFVNGSRKDDYVLKAGDIIRLGTVEIRFVAPGEPYDFNPPEEDRYSLEPPKTKKDKKIFALIIAAAVLGVAAIAAGVYFLLTPEDTNRGPRKPQDVQTFETLMESGKDKMQSEEWTEAAKLFAMAQQKDPGGNEAREMKVLAVKEADAQNAFNIGLAAQENQNWKEAVDSFSQIPRSSHYYDADQLRAVSSSLCEELLEKASFVEKTGTRSELDDVIQEIFQIPLAPERCRGNKAKILSEVEKLSAAEKDGGMLSGIEEDSQNKHHRRESRAKKSSAGLPVKRPKKDAKPARTKMHIDNPYIDNPYDE